MPIYPLRALDRSLLARDRRIREDLHRHPELGYEERRTAGVIARRLRELGIETATGIGGTGVVGLLRGSRKGKTVALRAEMDALPITEDSGLPYASTVPGKMHACGHDGHCAILLATAEILAGMRARIAGQVKFIFQPAEEGGAGALKMRNAGVLKNPKPDAIFGLHGVRQAPLGSIELGILPYAAVNEFIMDVIGKGCHGAQPHHGVDPIVIAAHIITASQTILTREMRPDDPLVLSFCAIHAGTKSNIIADQCRILGTIRAVQMDSLKRVRRSLGRVAATVARSMRGRVRIADGNIYPPTRNDEPMMKLVDEVAHEILGPGKVQKPAEQCMGGEDFSFFLKAQGGVPGAHFQLGLGPGPNLHSSRFDFGSAALKPGILMMANVALKALE